MASELRTIVYCSRTQIHGTHAQIAAELVKLLAGARAKNASLQITGALLFNEVAFAQVLEGPADALGPLIESIRRDPRHRDLVIALDQPMTTRSFPKWSMAFAEQAESPLPSAAIDAVLANSPLAGEAMLAALKAQVLQEEHWDRF
jgi:hypothetical protein